jgi:hypothetical protein
MRSEAQDVRRRSSPLPDLLAVYRGLQPCIVGTRQIGLVQRFGAANLARCPVAPSNALPSQVLAAVQTTRTAWTPGE